MNTEQIKDLHFSLMCWQDDYDPMRYTASTKAITPSATRAVMDEN